MDMAKVDKDIAALLAEGKRPVLLLGVNSMRELANNIQRSPGTRARYRNAEVILNACNPDKCEVVVRE